MTRDEQARARLVEIAHEYARPGSAGMWAGMADVVRARAGFRDPSKGSWSAAGLTAAMEDAGLVVPAPGTPARRGAVALLEFVIDDFEGDRIPLDVAQPGDIIAWLQHPQPDPAGWRRGHVAVIVAVDAESVTTVGWSEGAAPGRVMMRRLWRTEFHACATCDGDGFIGSPYTGERNQCRQCKGNGRVPRSSTVIWRRPGGIYGIARPVAA
jgi:hypothetical protein